MRHIITSNYVSGAVKRARFPFDIHTEIYVYLREYCLFILVYYATIPCTQAIFSILKQHSF